MSSSMKAFFDISDLMDSGDEDQSQRTGIDEINPRTNVVVKKKLSYAKIVAASQLPPKKARLSSVENVTQEFSYMSPTKARSYYQGTTHEQVVKPPPAVEVVDLTRDDDDDGFTLVQSKTSKKAAKTTLNKSVASGDLRKFFPKRDAPPRSSATSIFGQSSTEQKIVFKFPSNIESKGVAKGYSIAQLEEIVEENRRRYGLKEQPPKFKCNRNNGHFVYTADEMYFKSNGDPSTKCLVHEIEVHAKKYVATYNAKNNPKHSQDRKEKPLVKFSSVADGWRNKKGHQFSNGPPTNRQAKFFLFKLLQHHAEGRGNFAITDPNVAYLDPTNAQLDALESWFIRNVDNFVGAETGIQICFLADTWNMISFDRQYSGMGANEVGQVWIVDTWFWNRLMNDLNPTARTIFVRDLIYNYRPDIADLVIFCHEHNLSDDVANELLADYGVKRVFAVKKSSRIYGAQDDIRRTGSSRRDWSEREMIRHWKELCSMCLTTGIPDAISDINWNRIWDLEGRYRVGHVFPQNVRINDACRAHPAFRSQQSMRDYQHAHDIPLDLHPFHVVNRIIRPMLETLIITQTSKPDWI